MKIRADFVTNSSSTSSVFISFSCKVITDILRRYQELPQTEDYTIKRNTCTIQYDDIDAECPKQESEMADRLIDALLSLCKRNGVNEATAEKLVAELRENKERIQQTITSLDWQIGECGWDEFADEYDEDDKGNDDEDEDEDVITEYSEEASYDGKTFTYTSGTYTLGYESL